MSVQRPACGCGCGFPVASTQSMGTSGSAGMACFRKGCRSQNEPPHPSLLPGGEGTVGRGNAGGTNDPLSRGERVRVRGRKMDVDEQSPHILALILAFSLRGEGPGREDGNVG